MAEGNMRGEYPPDKELKPFLPTREDMQSPDLYRRLGLPPWSTPREIREQYRRLIGDLHPDVNPEHKELAALVTEGYNVLKDSAKKEKFDRGYHKIFGEDVRYHPMVKNMRTERQRAEEEMRAAVAPPAAESQETAVDPSVPEEETVPAALAAPETPEASVSVTPAIDLQPDPGIYKPKKRDLGYVSIRNPGEQDERVIKPTYREPIPAQELAAAVDDAHIVWDKEQEAKTRTNETAVALEAAREAEEAERNAMRMRTWKDGSRDMRGIDAPLQEVSGQSLKDWRESVNAPLGLAELTPAESRKTWREKLGQHVGAYVDMLGSAPAGAGRDMARTTPEAPTAKVAESVIDYQDVAPAPSFQEVTPSDMQHRVAETADNRGVEHWSEEGREMQDFLAKRGKEIDIKAEKLGVGAFVRGIGEKYNNLNWKWKLATGVALGTAAAVSIPFSATLAAGLGGVIGIQRGLGGLGMFVKFEKHLKEVSEGKMAGGRIGKQLAKTGWYKKLAEGSDTKRTLVAAGEAGLYILGFSAAVGEVVHLGAGAVESWLGNMMGHGSAPIAPTHLETHVTPGTSSASHLQTFNNLDKPAFQESEGVNPVKGIDFKAPDVPGAPSAAVPEVPHVQAGLAPHHIAHHAVHHELTPAMREKLETEYLYQWHAAHPEAGDVAVPQAEIDKYIAEHTPHAAVSAPATDIDKINVHRANIGLKPLPQPGAETAPHVEAAPASHVEAPTTVAPSSVETTPDLTHVGEQDLRYHAHIDTNPADVTSTGSSTAASPTQTPVMPIDQAHTPTAEANHITAPPSPEASQVFLSNNGTPIDPNVAHGYATPRGIYAFGGDPNTLDDRAQDFVNQNKVSVFVDKSYSFWGIKFPRVVEYAPNPAGGKPIMVIHNDIRLLPDPKTMFTQQVF